MAAPLAISATAIWGRESEMTKQEAAVWELICQAFEAAGAQDPSSTLTAEQQRIISFEIAEIFALKKEAA